VCFCGFTEKLKGNPQHAKALPVFFIEVFVMDLVGLPDGSKIGVFGVSEPFESSVDEDVMHQEITQPIGGNACSNPKTEVTVNAARHKAPSTGHGENQKEGIVLLEKSGFVLMMIPVEIPHGAMHEVFVSTPSHPFHGAECGQNDEGSD
jgi:hypothetical protein